MVAESPLVSIVMPTWNSMRYLDDCVQSLLNQTYSRFELLICDGGSTDGTLEYFASLDDNRFRIVSRKDSGLVNSLNIGFSHAQGDILCWLNSDDVYLNNAALELIVEQFQKRREINYVITGNAMLSESGDAVRCLLPWIPQPPFSYKGYSNVFTGGLFFLKSTWRQFGGFSEKNRFAFEYELIAHLFANPKAGVCCHSSPIAGFRLREDSVSGANAKALLDERSKLVGGEIKEPTPVLHQLIRLYSYFRMGLLALLISYRKINKRLPVKHQNLNDVIN
jgi:glycosyltransferase involved in cell wall biosynthesis